MEKFGLSLEELEGQYTELLPDRIEMRRARRRRRNRGGGGVSCVVVQFAGGDNDNFGNAASALDRGFAGGGPSNVCGSIRV